MGKINVLDKNVSELIAAGEVIERPASIVKELLENSIDAKATAITVELKDGGISFIRITDNGIGFEREDVPVAFLRHATSKVKNQDDLEHIATLGFRGEALASIAAVSKIEMLTKTAEQDMGTRIVIHGGETVDLDDAGCPNGTTILVRDLFYNVPARLKFLKKNVSEGNAVQGIVEKIAVSHPEISIKLVKDNKTVLHTAGDSQLISAIHAVYGREFANSLIQVDYAYQGVEVSGYISKPSFSRKNRAMQHFFVNERYVKSRTCLVALEEGYKNSIMVSRFPACVLKLKVGFDQVDVNVHPAKIEIRFVDEKAAFDAVYFAVKTALQKADILTTQVNEDKPFAAQLPFENLDGQAHQMKWSAHSAGQNAGKGKTPPSEPEERFLRIPAAQYQEMISKGGSMPLRSPSFSEQEPPLPGKVHSVLEEDARISTQGKAPSPAAEEASPVVEKIQQLLHSQSSLSEAVPKDNAPKDSTLEDNDLGDRKAPESPFQFISQSAFEKREAEPVQTKPAVVLQEEEEERPPVRVIGELFQTYILCEAGDSFVMIDKHAAHERILFEKLKVQLDLRESQVLLAPVKILLSREECSVIREYEDEFLRYGFRFQIDEEHGVLLTEAPLILHRYDLVAILQEIVENIRNQKSNLTPETFEDLLHSIACKSAIKANEHTTQEELEELVCQVYRDNRIRHCPHGRPVGITMTKYEIEKKFGRHQ